MRRNTPIKQAHKQSSSVLALMTNYPSTSHQNSHNSSRRIDDKYNTMSNDGEDEVVSKHVDGKQMIKLDPVISFLPLGSWKTYQNHHLPNRYFHISTSFNSTSLCIDSTSGADYFKLQCTGVVALKVLFREDLSESQNMSQSMSQSNPSRRFSRNVRTHVDDISIQPKHKVCGDPGGETLQELAFRSPWPCCHVEVSFTGLGGQFISVLSVALYGETLPSGLSTPIDALKSS